MNNDPVPMIDRWLEDDMDFVILGPKEANLGGPGSGNFDHKGRPGKIGGSAKGNSTISDDATEEDLDFLLKRKPRIKDEIKAEITEIVEDSFDKIIDIEGNDDLDEGTYSVMIVDDESTEPLIVTATTEKGKPFTVGKHRFITGGHYDPTAGDAREIVIFEADKIDKDSLHFILHHEIQHDRFNKFRIALDQQKQEISLAEANGEKIVDDYGDIIKKSDRKKYWAYNIDRVYIQGEASEALAAHDGVSNYSRAYWEKFETEGAELFGMEFEDAVNETLAEISRMRAGQLREGDKGIPWVADIWKDLYEDINSAGR